MTKGNIEHVLAHYRAIPQLSCILGSDCRRGTNQYVSFPKLAYAKSTRRRHSVVTDCACVQSACAASSGSVSNGFTLGFFRIHSERFLTDRGVPCFNSQKLNLYYWVKRQKIATDPSSPMITSNHKESGGG